MFPTVLEYFDISENVLQYPIHGRSLLPVLRGEKESVRESAIYGYFGKQIASDRISEFLAGMSQLGFTEQEILTLLEKRREEGGKHGEQE